MFGRAFDRSATVKAFVFAFTAAVAGAAAPTALAADSDGSADRCEQYRTLIDSSDRGIAASDISPALHTEESPFVWSDEGRQAALANALHQRLIPDECKATLARPALQRFTVVARGGINMDPQRYGRNDNHFTQLMRSYQAMANEAVKGTCGSAPSSSSHAFFQYIDCVEHRGGLAYQYLRHSIDLALHHVTQADAPVSPAGLTAQTALVFKAYTDVLRVSFTRDFDAGLDRVMSRYREMSVDQKLMIAQLVTYTGRVPGFDQERARGGRTSSGVVTAQEVLQAQERNILAGGASKDRVTALIRAAGVCRDIHPAAAKILAGLGMPNPVTVNYTTIDGEGHSTVAVQDSYRPMLNHQIDWGTRRDLPGGSSATLFQNGADVGNNYGIYNAAGRNIANIQSQQGIFLAGAAGFRPRDPLTHDPGGVLGGEVALGATGDTRVRVLQGQDGAGATYIAAGATQTWNRGGHLPSQAGIVLFTQARPAELMGGTRGKTYDIDGIYAQIQQRYVSGEAHVIGSLRARFEASLTLLGMAARSREGDPRGIIGFDAPAGAIIGDFQHYAGAAVVIDQGKPDERTQVTYQVSIQGGLGRVNVSNEDFPQVPVPVLDTLMIAAEVRHRLWAAGGAYLVTAAKAALDELGSRGRAELGVVANHAAFTVGAEGRLLNGSATYQDGSARRLFVSFSAALLSHLFAGATVFVPVEQDIPDGVGARGAAALTW